MIEVKTDPRIAKIYETAHQARADAFTGLFKGLFRRNPIPLGRKVLTGSSRWV